ncbi:DUF2268 domain-containing protein [Deinococcus koreensis]|uniref:DUF2268 domain-containing protein n=1 Tax=Deinococcus koreensis TaxID=2054903 RepID=A0A2K3V244_9DEIO|nr:DUF2268 domain-containing putative Zn-dependent protease [Deinococcus koreensis]PNY82853.1 hypothetical protein CVO96_03955 [Deinococcus koreensis]
MEIIEVNLLEALRGVLTSPAEAQPERFREQVMEPLRPVWEPIRRYMPPGADGADPALAVARTLKLYRPELDAESGLGALDTLAAADVFGQNRAALEQAVQALNPGQNGISLQEVHLVLTLAEPGGLGEDGYTGAGNTPGWVMLSVWPQALPDGADNFCRLPAITAHEFNHNVRFAQPDWTFPMTLGAYLVAEGLAECFAAELHGEASLGSWTTTLREPELRALAPRYGAALLEQDFGLVRGYIFGDAVMENFGGLSGKQAKLGIPPYAGYALGYHVVRDYLARTGRSAAQATYDPWRVIVAGSGWFTVTDGGQER